MPRHSRKRTNTSAEQPTLLHFDHNDEVTRDGQSSIPLADKLNTHSPSVLENYALPVGWQWATISDLISNNGLFIDGDWVESKDQDPEGDVRLIQLADIGDGDFRDKSARFLTTSSAYKLRCTFLNEGDVLIARMPDPLGRACIFPGDPKPSVTVVDVCIIRSGNDEFDHRWLMYFINAYPFRSAISGLQSGSTRKRISRGNLSKIPLPIPPIEEQRRIVSEIEKHLSRLDVGVAALRRAQANLKRYRTSTLRDACEGRLVPIEADLARIEGHDYENATELLRQIMTNHSTEWKEQRKSQEPVSWKISKLPSLPEGWLWCDLNNLLSFVTSGSRGWAQYYSESGPLFIRIANLDHENIRLDLQKRKYVNPPIGTEGVRTSVKVSDLLISITADVGMVALVPEGLGEAYINQHIALARPVQSVCPAYLAYYLCASEGGWGRFKMLQHGATKVGLRLDDIRSLPVPLPPLIEQQRIVAEIERRLSVVDELEAVVMANLRRAMRLRQAILNQAFSGKIVEQKSSDEPAKELLGRSKKPVKAPTSAKTPVKKDVKKMSSKPAKSLEDVLDRLDNLGGAVEPERLFAALQLGAFEDAADKFFEWLREGRDKGILDVPVGESGTIHRKIHED